MVAFQLLWLTIFPELFKFFNREKHFKLHYWGKLPFALNGYGDNDYDDDDDEKCLRFLIHSIK